MDEYWPTAEDLANKPFENIASGSLTWEGSAFGVVVTDVRLTAVPGEPGCFVLQFAAFVGPNAVVGAFFAAAACCKSFVLADADAGLSYTVRPLGTLIEPVSGVQASGFSLYSHGSFRCRRPERTEAPAT